MKIKITHEAEEREQAGAILQFARQLLPRCRIHETEQDGRRVLYLTARKGAGNRESLNERRTSREKGGD